MDIMVLFCVCIRKVGGVFVCICFCIENWVFSVVLGCGLSRCVCELVCVCGFMLIIG